MFKVGNWYVATTSLAVSLLLVPQYSFADSYICQANHASGFVYDVERKSWESSKFSTENRQYLISRADTKNIFVKALRYDYEIKRADTSKPIIHCKVVKLNDSNQETGLVTCRGTHGESFEFDKNSGRYIRSQPAGYVTEVAAAETGGGPYIEIGLCAPK